MTQLKYLKYLGIKHNYLENNCITIINDIYKKELNSYVFDPLWDYLNMPEGKPIDGKAWMRRFSIQDIEKGASLVAKKVNLTDLQEYDVILFKSGRLVPTHFGMYVGYNKFIHLEEGRLSKIDNLDDNWRVMIASIWRQIGINT